MSSKALHQTFTSYLEKPRWDFHPSFLPFSFPSVVFVFFFVFFCHFFFSLLAPFILPSCVAFFHTCFPPFLLLYPFILSLFLSFFIHSFLYFFLAPLLPSFYPTYLSSFPAFLLSLCLSLVDDSYVLYVSSPPLLSQIEDLSQQAHKAAAEKFKMPVTSSPLAPPVPPSLTIKEESEEEEEEVVYHLKLHRILN